jgi:rfaE bifunctional protein kinase chain/domain
MYFEKKKETVFVSGNFNIVHPGHLRLLRFAKSSGSKLLVGVISDKLAKKNAIVNEKLRLEALKSNIWVDECFVINEPIVDYLKKIKPDIVVKGKEHEKLFNIEKRVLDTYGGKLIFSSGDVSFSSMELLNSEFSSIKLSNSLYASKYFKRHNIDRNSFIPLINKFSKLNVLVVGDLIIDDYIDCEPLGMSQEDPTLVVTPYSKKRFVGGAGIVASHASSMGANVSFISVVGNDEAFKFAESKLRENNVKAELIVDITRPTILKKRYRAKLKTLLRVSELRQENISKDLQNVFLEKFRSNLKKIDLIIFSDFNYGCLPDDLITEMTSLAKKMNIKMVADCQSSSQIGDIGRYKEMELITPTEREARLSLKNISDSIFILAEKLTELTNPKHLLLKLGSEGCLVYTNSRKKDDPGNRDQLKAYSNSVVDEAGAGDSMLVTTALALASKASIWESSYLGSLAAGIQINQLGNVPITKNQLIELLQN